MVDHQSQYHHVAECKLWGYLLYKPVWKKSRLINFFENTLLFCRDSEWQAPSLVRDWSIPSFCKWWNLCSTPLYIANYGSLVGFPHQRYTLFKSSPTGSFLVSALIFYYSASWQFKYVSVGNCTKLFHYLINKSLTDVYYLAFPGDRAVLKLAVAWVYLVGIVQTVLTMIDIQKSLRRRPPTIHNTIQTLIEDPVHIWWTVMASSAAGENLLVASSNRLLNSVAFSGSGSPVALCLQDLCHFSQTLDHNTHNLCTFLFFLPMFYSKSSSTTAVTDATGKFYRGLHLQWNYNLRL